MAILIRLQDFQPKNPAKEYVKLHADRKTVSLGRQVLESSDPNRHDAFIQSARNLAMSLEEQAESITGRAGSMAVGEMARMAEFKFAAAEKLFALRTAVANMSMRIHQLRPSSDRAQVNEEMLEASTALYNYIDSHHWLARRALWIGGMMKADPARLYFSKSFRILFQDMTTKSAVTAGVVALASGAAWVFSRLS